MDGDRDTKKVGKEMGRRKERQRMAALGSETDDRGDMMGKVWRCSW